jgi:hypothetical protein
MHKSIGSVTHLEHASVIYVNNSCPTFQQFLSTPAVLAIVGRLGHAAVQR